MTALLWFLLALVLLALEWLGVEFDGLLAAALAALMAGHYRPAPTEHVAVLLCGANLAPDPLASMAG